MWILVSFIHEENIELLRVSYASLGEILLRWLKNDDNEENEKFFEL